jgi:HEAT repeat protein
MKMFVHVYAFLGEIGDKSAIPYLQKAMRDKSKLVREAAKESIKKLTQTSPKNQP